MQNIKYREINYARSSHLDILRKRIKTNKIGEKLFLNVVQYLYLNAIKRILRYNILKYDIGESNRAINASS